MTDSKIKKWLEPDPALLRDIARTLGVGLAIVNPETLEVRYENENFFRWFPPESDADAPANLRIGGFNTERVRTRTENGRTYIFEVETSAGGRITPIAVHIRLAAQDGQSLFVVECHDISKQKQAEYMLESYSKLAEKNARELQHEKDRVERLLLNVMPKAVYEEMRDYGTVSPQLFDSASILMIDFVGHTEMAIARDAAALVTELNDMFNVFDRITDMFGCERIRTIGDAYMAVSGLPETTPDHAANVARVALRILRYIERRNATHAEEWICRIGINSGPVVGSLVGVQKYVYDIFGPGVNMAARMESLSEPMRITISENTYKLIKDDFDVTDRGLFEVKGFGEQRLYFLEREQPHMKLR